MSNTFGRLFRLTTFGESHGPALGGVIDGCPSGLPFDEALMRRELELRRADSASPTSTPRNEPDRPQILSGLIEGRTSGAPLAFVIENQAQNSADYETTKNIYRPGHADYTWDAKYGLRDWRGGGRASGRETLSRVAGGAVALAFLRGLGLHIDAYTLSLGGLSTEEAAPGDIAEYAPRELGAPRDSVIPAWRKLVQEAKERQDSLGGVVRLEAHGLPVGLGEPVFDKLDARIGAAMFSVGSVKGVEIGDGFAAAAAWGSQHNDALLPHKNLSPADDPQRLQASFASNHSGGTLGGISTGQMLKVNVAVKPVPSIGSEQQSLSRQGQSVRLKLAGRHDISVIPRINVVLKAMLALTLADFALLARASRI
ncbi:MAG: chorismate synthase [Deltaproteobacteria bacterium]|jgi:chorismate synthase|nr:chorismate synthase [Deltaproteobacteria bacterium]